MVRRPQEGKLWMQEKYGPFRERDTEGWRFAFVKGWARNTEISAKFGENLSKLGRDS